MWFCSFFFVQLLINSNLSSSLGWNDKEWFLSALQHIKASDSYWWMSHKTLLTQKYCDRALWFWDTVLHTKLNLDTPRKSSVNFLGQPALVEGHLHATGLFVGLHRFRWQRGNWSVPTSPRGKLNNTDTNIGHIGSDQQRPNLRRGYEPSYTFVQIHADSSWIPMDHRHHPIFMRPSFSREEPSTLLDMQIRPKSLDPAKPTAGHKRVCCCCCCCCCCCSCNERSEFSMSVGSKGSASVISPVQQRQAVNHRVEATPEFACLSY